MKHTRYTRNELLGGTVIASVTVEEPATKNKGFAIAEEQDPAALF